MSHNFFLSLIASLFVLSVISAASAQEPSAPDTDKQTQEEPKPEGGEESGDSQNKGDQTVETKKIPPALAHTLKSIDGEDIDLSQYAGKVVVIVNTASKCGMTPQYKDLQKLHKKYADKGVVVLGFPCNQFGGQEPAGESDIKQFCEKNYGVEFPLFSKVDVKGKNANPLFKELSEMDAKPAGAGDVKWNFEKFVINRSGKLVARFGSRVKPGSEEFVAVIESALKEESPPAEDAKDENKTQAENKGSGSR